MGLHDRNPARVRFTSEGGLALRLTNRTGTTSQKGKVVRCSAAYDNAVNTAEANSIHPIGVMYDSGVADGSECWVVFSGRAQVLFKDGQGSVHGQWVGTSDTAGRAFAENDPSSTDVHRQEIGHCMESKNSGTDVLVYVDLHFN